MTVATASERSHSTASAAKATALGTSPDGSSIGSQGLRQRAQYELAMGDAAPADKAKDGALKPAENQGLDLNTANKLFKEACYPWATLKNPEEALPLFRELSLKKPSENPMRTEDHEKLQNILYSAQCSWGMLASAAKNPDEAWEALKLAQAHPLSERKGREDWVLRVINDLALYYSTQSGDKAKEQTAELCRMLANHESAGLEEQKKAACTFVARFEYNRGRYSEALKWFGRIAADKDAGFYVAMSHYCLGNYAEAVKRIDESQDPRLIKPSGDVLKIVDQCRVAAALKLSVKQPDAAAAALSKVVEDSPLRAEADLVKSLCSFSRPPSLKQIAGAEKCFQDMTGRKPEERWCEFELRAGAALADCCRESGQFIKACQHLDEAVEQIKAAAKQANGRVPPEMARALKDLREILKGLKTQAAAKPGDKRLGVIMPRVNKLQAETEPLLSQE